MTYTTSTTKSKASNYDLPGIEDMVPTYGVMLKSLMIDIRYGVSHIGDNNVITHVKVMRKHGYGYLEEIVNQLINLLGDDVADFAIALRMFTRSLVIQKRDEDLQLGVKSYQKKINVTKPDTTRLDLRKSDGTLTRLLSSLEDITKNIDMEYLPKRRWSNLEKKRAYFMIKNINKLLKERRMMRSLEKYVGGRSSWIRRNDLKMRQSVKVKEIQERCIIKAFQDYQIKKVARVGHLSGKDPLVIVVMDTDHLCICVAEVDSFACPASFPWHTGKNVSRDPFPKSTEFSADDYVVLIDLLAFIQVADPTKVKVGERERAEKEARLLDSIVRRVVLLLPIASARPDSELEASIDMLFDEGGSADQTNSAGGGGQETETEIVMSIRFVADENVVTEKPKRPRKKRQGVTNASGSSDPPKKLRGDHETSSRAATGVNLHPSLRSCWRAACLMLKLVSRLWFVISSDSSHHFATNASRPEDDSIIRSAAIPPVITEAVVTSHAVNIPLVPEMGIKVTPPVHASMFHDFDSTETVKADTMGPSYSAKQDLSMGSRELKSKTMRQVFVPQWNMLNDSLLDDYDTSQEFVDHLAPPALLKMKIVEKYKGSATARKEAEAAKVFSLHDQVSADEAMDKMRADEIDALKQRNVVLKKKDGLVDQVSGYERLKEKIEEFQDAQMNIVDDKVAKLDIDLLEMALHLEEKFYPHLLTTISGRRWLLTHGLKLAIVNCLNSQENLSTLELPLSVAIDKGMRMVFRPALYPWYSGRSFVKSVSSLLRLKSHKDASVEDIINLLQLEGPLADAPGISDLQPHVD
ncbi:hypothetical protein Tco_0098145 [Tanacetum coccineum]